MTDQNQTMRYLQLGHFRDRLSVSGGVRSTHFLPFCECLPMATLVLARDKPLVSSTRIGNGMAEVSKGNRHRLAIQLSCVAIGQLP